jgi:hypothetical protein
MSLASEWFDANPLSLRVQADFACGEIAARIFRPRIACDLHGPDARVAAADVEVLA